MLNTILAIISGFLPLISKLADLFRARAEKAQRDEAKDDGASAAENETLQTIADVADVQTLNNAAAPSDPSVVADRLRRDASAAARGADQPGPGLNAK